MFRLAGRPYQPAASKLWLSKGACGTWRWLCSLLTRQLCAGGLPIGAVLVSQKVADAMNPGDHGAAPLTAVFSLSAATNCQLLSGTLLAQSALASQPAQSARAAGHAHI